jgi:hypothetical protein
MSRRPPAALRAEAARLILECPDCAGLAFGLRWSDDRAAWTMRVYHLPTCPSRRSARRERAADRWLIDQASAVVPLTHYGSDIVTTHRMRPVP